MKRAAFLTICPLMALGTLSLFGVSALDLFSPTSAQSPTEAAPQPLPDHAVARIGDDLVYADEVLERVQELEISRQLPADKQLVGPAYEYAINTRLLQLEATRLQILCTDSDKKNETDKHIERLKLKVKQDFGG
ncbi:MAG: hypothetical protein KDB07_11750, partial [Planctomycetes bacterium]|nr:hypothetical protein [Planctomycetota bacterium]